MNLGKQWESAAPIINDCKRVLSTRYTSEYRPTHRPTTDPSADRPTDQPTDRPTQRPNDPPTDPLTHRPTHNERTTHRPIDRPTNRPANQPTDPSTHRTADRPTHPVIKTQHANSFMHSFHTSVDHSIKSTWSKEDSIVEWIRLLLDFVRVAYPCDAVNERESEQNHHLRPTLRPTIKSLRQKK